MRRGLTAALTLSLLGGCAEPRAFETWPLPKVEVAVAPARSPTLDAVLPRLDERSNYGASPSSCEGFEVIVDQRGRPRHKRIRKPWTKTDRHRFRGLVGLVASELGAEPRLFQAWALRESTYRPSALHVLNPDVQGATTAWRKYAYDAEAEARLEARMDATEATDPDYWQVKGQLARLRRFKGNPHLFATVDYKTTGPDGTVSSSQGSAWAFGYGPFGFNPAYFVQVWDAKSPPWVFCHDDGLAAIVTAIWSARAHQRECEAADVGGSYLVLNHRLGRGHCAMPDPQSKFIDRLGRVGLDAHARAKLGKKYPQAETDRAALLEHLRARARQEGLLSPLALGRGPA